VLHLLSRQLQEAHTAEDVRSAMPVERLILQSVRRPSLGRA
jgi:hypothetical protein